MAGSQPGFNATEVRQALRFAMQMGAPPTVGDRATFHFRGGQPQRVYYKDGVLLDVPPALDNDGYPLDPTITWENIWPDDPLQVDCAIEFADATADETPVGAFLPTKITVTLLDTEFELVKRANLVEVGGDMYSVQYRKPPLGLFDLQVWQIVAFAMEET